MRRNGKAFACCGGNDETPPDHTMDCDTRLTDLAEATQSLLDDMGEPEDGAQANLMARCRAAIAKATA
jgi:hypothetical protein